MAGDLDSVELLLKKGVNIESPNVIGETGFFIACRKNHFKLIVQGTVVTI